MSITSNQFRRVAASTTQDILNRERVDMFGFYPMGETTIDSLNPVDSVTIIEDMHKLWLQNPMAFRFVETFNHFVTGDGLVYKAEDKEVQKVLDNFWKHPINKWDINYQSRIKGLSLNGEMILRPEITEFSGKVKMNNLYPGRVSEVAKEPGNDEALALIKFNNIEKPMKVIKWIETPEGGKYEGDIFYFPVNKTPFQTRGLADLYFWRDWLKLYDKNLYSTAKRSGLLLSFIWDITMTGANPQQLLEKEAQIKLNPPTPGSYRIHNETEKWEPETPSLAGRDLKEINELVKSQSIAGSGMPEYYYGTGENTNLAVARVMGVPFFKLVKARQKYIEYIFSEIFRYVIWVAEQKKMLTGDRDKTFNIVMPEPDNEKANVLAESLNKFATAVLILETNGYISRPEAQSVVNLITSQLGIEIKQEGDETQNEKVMEAASKYMKAMEKKEKKRA